MDIEKIKKEAIELVQKIGREVCEDCGPDADCGEDPEGCTRISAAIHLLADFMPSNIKSSGPQEAAPDS